MHACHQTRAPWGTRRTDRCLLTLPLKGVTQIDRVVEVVEETLKGNVVQLLAKKALPSLDLPKVRKNRHVEIIPLSTGCLGACTYCKTKHARGHLGSYQPDALVSRVEQAAADPEVRPPAVQCLPCCYCFSAFIVLFLLTEGASHSGGNYIKLTLTFHIRTFHPCTGT